MTSHLSGARPGPAPSPAPPGGPAGRYLTNPGGYTGHLARLLLSALAHYGPVAGPLLAVAVTAVIAGRAWLRRRQHAAFAEAARQVTVLAPPQAGPGGRGGAVGAPDRAAAPALGAAVARAAAPGLGIRLGRRHRRRDDDPPVGARHPPARPDRARRRGGLARRAHRHRPGRPAAAARRRHRRRARCGWPARTSCRCRPAMTRKRRCGHWPGPRPASPTASTPSCRCSPGRSPEPGSARRAAPPASSAAGQPARITSRLLDLASPGHGPSASRSRAACRSDPELAAEIRETTAKLAGPQWETLDPLRGRHHRPRRRPATGPPGGRPAPPPPSRRPGCAAWPTPWPRPPPCSPARNWLARRRLRRPAAVIAARRLTKG